MIIDCCDLFPTSYGSPTVGENRMSSWLALRRRLARTVSAVTPHALHHFRIFGRLVLHDCGGAPGLGVATVRGAARELHSVVPEGELTLLWTVSPFP